MVSPQVGETEKAHRDGECNQWVVERQVVPFCGNNTLPATSTLSEVIPFCRNNALATLMFAGKVIAKPTRGCFDSNNLQLLARSALVIKCKSIISVAKMRPFSGNDWVGISFLRLDKMRNVVKWKHLENYWSPLSYPMQWLEMWHWSEKYFGWYFKCIFCKPRIRSCTALCAASLKDSETFEAHFT